MTLQPLFAYGTLLDDPVQQHIIGRAVPTTPNVLDGYRKDQLNLGTETYPRVTPDVAASVSGGVLLLTEAELARTDAYEGDEYVRVWVTLRDGSEAWVYAAPIAG